MLERNAAEGIHRVEDAHVNWYLVEETGRLTVVAAGLPRSWGSLRSALATLHRARRHRRHRAHARAIRPCSPRRSSITVEAGSLYLRRGVDHQRAPVSKVAAVGLQSTPRRCA